jgi:hypothetical protein
MLSNGTETDINMYNVCATQGSLIENPTRDTWSRRTEFDPSGVQGVFFHSWRSCPMVKALQTDFTHGIDQKPRIYKMINFR